MKDRSHILLLAGSVEARQMAEAMTARSLSYAAWLSESPRGMAPMPQCPILRPLKDATAMRAAIVEEGFNAIVDAGHAFDAKTTAQGFAAATVLGLPYVRVVREPWKVSGAQDLKTAHDVAAANTLIPQGARVFCGTGWDSLPDYKDFRGEVLMLRQTRRHRRPVPYPFVELIFGDPPFTTAAERALFERLRVDMLICRNLGGAGSRPKVDAALDLGLQVILIDRPRLPVGLQEVVQVDDAVAWLEALICI